MTKTIKTPTGELLKRRREELQLSLSDIHDKTKISLRMLKNIEQDDMPRDVPKVCLKGFIQSYCECVNLKEIAINDAPEIKEEQNKFSQNQEKETEAKPKKINIAAWPNYKNAMASWNRSTILLTLAISAILLMWGYNIFAF